MEKKILSKRDIGDGIQTTIQLSNSDKSNITTDEISQIVNKFSTGGNRIMVRALNIERWCTLKGMNEELDNHAKELETKEQFEAAAICRKNRLRIDDVMTTYGTFVQKSKADLNKTKIVEAYDDFMYTHKAKLEEDFYAINDFHTSMRGVKVRGVYGNPKEAELKAKAQ